MLNTLIQEFSTENLNAFLRSKMSSYATENENLDYIFNDNLYEKYESVTKLGEASISKDDKLIVIASKTNEALTERTGKKNQYEIAKKVLREEFADASLFIFYDDKGSFRFSFVKANYFGTKRTFTEFKRYTYYVSKEQTNRTFIEQIEKCTFDSLENILEAFSVEPLNKEFYKEINKAFYTLIGGTIGKGRKKQDLDAVLQLPNINNKIIVKEFAVRLIGRTIFCWFLKSKKSEKGLPLVPEVWLSSRAVEDNENYYHSILEKLFFLTLNKKIEERKNLNLPEGHENIPFLNGGLFEPHSKDFFINNANDKLIIPNEWFADLFQVLEQFNFTIDENSTSDAEVSIDPEMLGTIFENLLAEIDPDTEKSARNSTGSFYTPREIVDYMVEQSLVQYLKTKTKITDEDKLLQLFKESSQKNEFTNKETKKILEALSTVSILDPACGSGAFPMGAVQKIILALKQLDPEAEQWKAIQLSKYHGNSTTKKKLEEKLSAATSDYARKLGVIQNAIYGVDIQSIATDISKLRSFLSLVIDENIEDEAENRGIEPLPNLEFKFVTANTLISLPKEEEEQQTELFTNYDELSKLEELRNDYFQSTGKKKDEIKENFIKLQKKAFENEHNLFANQESRAYKLISWNPFSNETSSWFDPQWMFGIEKFDIVIGNPPYIKEYENRNAFDGFRENSPYYKGKMDIWYGFACNGIDLLKNNGIECFIAQNNWVTSAGASIFRNKVLEETQIKLFTDFGDYKAFKSAGIQTMVYLLKKDNTKEKYSLKYSLLKNKKISKTELIGFLDFKKQNNDISEKYTLDFNNTHYFNTLITFNNPIIDNILNLILRNEIEYLEDKEVAQGIVCPQNKLNKKNSNILGGSFEENDGVFQLNELELSKLELNDYELNLIKPIYSTIELCKYYGSNKNKEWLIYTKSNINNKIDFYPNLKRHLDKFQKIITSSNKPYGLHRARNEDFFKGEKILSLRKNYQPSFTYTNFDCYVTQTFYSIKTTRLNMRYLIGLLNSKLIAFWLRYKGKMQGNNYQVDKEPLVNIPIKRAENEQLFVFIVDFILKIKEKEYNNQQSKSHIFEEIIDALVFELYFPEEFKKAGIELSKYVEQEFEDIADKTEEEQLTIIQATYERLAEKKNPLRNQIKLMKIELKELLNPILSV